MDYNNVWRILRSFSQNETLEIKIVFSDKREATHTIAAWSEDSDQTPHEEDRTWEEWAWRRTGQIDAIVKELVHEHNIIVKNISSKCDVNATITLEIVCQE